VLTNDDKEYLEALKAARLKILRGAQSYQIGSRSVTRADLRWIGDEISRLEGAARPFFKRIVPVDK